MYTAALIGINLYSVVLFFFAHFGLNIRHTFFIFCNFEMICLNREIILAVLLRHNSKTDMTKNRDKIVIFKKKLDIFCLL